MSIIDWPNRTTRRLRSRTFMLPVLTRSAAIAADTCCQSRQEVLGVRAGDHVNALLRKSKEIPS
jgi:hypothetical protein